MKKDKKNIAILVLFMEHQWEATLLTLRSIQEVMEEQCVVVILLNGSSSLIIEKQIQNEFPTFNYLCSEKNLGVAGGRNLLLRSTFAQEAEYIFLLDNDIILTKNYFSKMTDFLRKKPDAGVVGPLVFEAGPVLALFLNNVFSVLKKNINSEYNILSFDAETVIASWKKSNYPRAMHFGANKNWKIAYCSTTVRAINYISTFFLKKKAIKIFNIDNLSLIEEIKSGVSYIKASNIPGCATVFRKALLDQIGYLDDRFNPYGCEDVDFCIRAMKAGYINYVVTSSCIFHGTGTRQIIQDNYRTLNEEIKGLILLRRKHISNIFERILSIFGFVFSCFLICLAKSILELKIEPILYLLNGTKGGLLSKTE